MYALVYNKSSSKRFNKEIKTWTILEMDLDIYSQLFSLRKKDSERAYIYKLTIHLLSAQHLVKDTDRLMSDVARRMLIIGLSMNNS